MHTRIVNHPGRDGHWRSNVVEVSSHPTLSLSFSTRHKTVRETQCPLRNLVRGILEIHLRTHIQELTTSSLSHSYSRTPYTPHSHARSAFISPHVELYEFVGSCWANVPKIAISETGWKDGEIEWVSINLAEVCDLRGPLLPHQTYRTGGARR